MRAVTDAEAVRHVALALPRAYEQLTGGRWKLKVKQLVFVAFSKDEERFGSASRGRSATP